MGKSRLVNNGKCKFAWSSFSTFVLFTSLKHAGFFRLDLESEMEGDHYSAYVIGGGSPVATKFSTFLSHKWDPTTVEQDAAKRKSIKALGGENHRRCVLINEGLEEIGFLPWLDTNGGCQDQIANDICLGIDQSQTFTILVTKEYCEEVVKGTDNYCGAEFNY